MSMTRRKTHEEFVAEVKALVGDEYTVLGTYIKNDIKVAIKHNECGYVTDMLPRNFTSGRRCARCAGRARTTESFKQEIHKLTGGEYTVLGEYITNRTHVRVLHEKCGTQYDVMPTNILRGKQCPSCKSQKISDAVRKTPEFFETQFKELCGDEYTLMSTYKTAKEYVQVRHIDCGHIYNVVPDSIIRGSRCPKCNESKGEKKISDFLKLHNIEYESEYNIKYARDKHPLRLDFYVGGVAIEYDGEQHFKPVKHFGGDSYFKETQQRDCIKNRYCADNGIQLIRISYLEFHNIDAILTEKLLPLLEVDASSTQKQAS